MIYVSHSRATAERSKGGKKSKRGRMHQQRNIMHCTIYPELDSLIYSIKRAANKSRSQCRNGSFLYVEWMMRKKKERKIVFTEIIYKLIDWAFHM